MEKGLVDLSIALLLAGCSTTRRTSKEEVLQESDRFLSPAGSSSKVGRYL